MRKFEYKEEVAPFNEDIPEAKSRLNRLGSEGWMLVAVGGKRETNQSILWLMREIE